VTQTLAAVQLDSTTESRLAALQSELAPYRLALVEHPMYAELTSLPRMRIFMQHHVFAVWDFMSLLKWLQRELTCINVPWRPRGDALSRRLINEIVLGEETDIDGEGGFASHFELYLDAMEQCGADTAPVQQLLERLDAGEPLATALQEESIPPGARQFMQATFRLIDTAAPHRVAAAFALGREDLIPDMFQALVEDLHTALPGKLSKLVDYLQRHIELDGDEHTPLALRMLANLSGNDDRRWEEAQAAAIESLQARYALWDSVRDDCAKLSD
jgi:hypothetical protein